MKQGTYDLTIGVTGTDGSTVAKTVTVTVFGPPITITTQPQDTSVSCEDGDVDSWQGDKKIQVTATRAESLTDPISYQWKLEGGTVLTDCTGYELSLQDLFTGGKLTQQTDKPWLYSAKVYCTLAYGSYSVDTDIVTLTVNTCTHELANPDGTCQQCGEPCSQEPMLVHEDGTYIVVPDESATPSEVGTMLAKGGTFYLTQDVTHRGLNAEYSQKVDKDVILDLQGHTLDSLRMANFPVKSITLKNSVPARLL